jgi:hypothetical protein
MIFSNENILLKKRHRMQKNFRCHLWKKLYLIKPFLEKRLIDNISWEMYISPFSQVDSCVFLEAISDADDFTVN